MAPLHRVTRLHPGPLFGIHHYDVHDAHQSLVARVLRDEATGWGWCAACQVRQCAHTLHVAKRLADGHVLDRADYERLAG